MKFTSWRTWLWNKLGRFLRPKRPRTLATAGCVALGLATAWGGEADADITFKVEVTPAHDLMDAFVYFGNNATGANAYPLGSLSADEPHTFLLNLPGSSGFYLDDTPEYYQPGGNAEIGFAVGGIYELDGEHGIVVSYIDSSPIDTQQSWEELIDFARPWHPESSEDELVDEYFAELARGLHHWNWTTLAELVGSSKFLTDIPEYPEGYSQRPLLADYGSEATLIAFGPTRFAGTANVTIVPEPTSIVLLVTTFGMIAIYARSRGESE